MVGAWMGLVEWAITLKHVVAFFKQDTGYDLMDALGSRGINKTIDEATGYTRQVVTAWADYITERLWGLEGQEPPEDDGGEG